MWRLSITSILTILETKSNTLAGMPDTKMPG